jgi:hypothetical protein
MEKRLTDRANVAEEELHPSSMQIDMIRRDCVEVKEHRFLSASTPSVSRESHSAFVEHLQQKVTDEARTSMAGKSDGQSHVYCR